MIAAFDVAYAEDGSAQAAAVVFARITDPGPYRVYRRRLTAVADYVPGFFYRRELPCILTLLTDIEECVETIIVDGYVTLGDRPGLGAHLCRNIAPGIAVIGVAKTPFAGGRPAEVLRGGSRKPLYVTAHGLGLEEAGRLIQAMHGSHRLPTLLKTVDRLSREPIR